MILLAITLKASFTLNSHNRRRSPKEIAPVTFLLSLTIVIHNLPSLITSIIVYSGKAGSIKGM